MNLKNRVARLQARIGVNNGRPVLRTFADFIMWETERRTANGGELTPEESAWVRAEFKTFMENSRVTR